MHQIYIGYSITMYADELIRYFDIDCTHPDYHSKFQQAFESSCVIQGNFEVYGRKFYQNDDFNEALFFKLLPFKPDISYLKQVDFVNAKSVFYLEIDSIKKMKSDDLTLIGPILIDKYDYEI